MKHAASKQGFTLLEIVLAITLLALMALMLVRVFSAGTRAVEQGRSQSMLDETARSLLDLIERDISQSLVRTNVPFRVETIESDPFNTLYFVSTGARRSLESIPRDTAPMKYRVSKTADWKLALQLLTPYGSAGTAPSNLEKLSEHSDYYFEAGNTAADFIGVQSRQSLSVSTRTYIEEIGTEAAERAMLTTFRIRVNGSDAWDGNAPDSTPDPGDLPRFADVQIGLVPSSVLRQVQQLAEAGRTEAAEKLIRRSESLYARRIFMPNTGIEGRDFP